jgi:hypothetical protein
MPTQYIKTLGALTINDGNPDNSLDIRTGGSGAITINGQAIGGGGGGGGDVFKAGNNNVAGDAQTFTCPINVGNPGAPFTLTVEGDIECEGNLVSKATGTCQVQGELDLAAGGTCAKITDGGKFEMQGAGGGAAVAELDPGSKTYTFGLNQGSGGTEATVNVQGNVVIKNGATNVITLNGQQVGANAGLVQAVGYTAEGAGGNYRGINGATTYARNDVFAIDTIVVSAGNTQEVRTGAIGARTTMHSLTYDVGNTQLVEDIKAAGTEKLVVTEKATVPAGSNYELMKQTQDDTEFLRCPIYTEINNYQMDVFTRITADNVLVSQGFNGSAILFSLGAGQTVWTGRSRNGVPFTQTPYNGTSVPFGRYRLLLKQRDVAGSTTCVGTAGIVNGLTISDEFLFTGTDAAAGQYGGLVFTDDHPVSYSFTRWSANATGGLFPLDAGVGAPESGHINIVRQTVPNGFAFYIKFTGWDVTILTDPANLPNATIAFNCELIRLPMIS